MAEECSSGLSMSLGLPYGGSKEESLRFLGLYTWLRDNEENPGIIDLERKDFYCPTDRVFKIHKLISENTAKLKPLECIMYCPFTFSKPFRSWIYFGNDMPDCEKTELMRCSVHNNPLFTIVMRLPLKNSIENGDVGEPSRAILELLTNANIFCRVWTSVMSPRNVFIALANDPVTVNHVIMICRAYDESNE